MNVLYVTIAMVVPTRSLVDEARRVEFAHKVDKEFRIVLVGLTAALVEEDPHDDTGRVVVRLNKGCQFAFKVVAVVRAALAAVVLTRHILPHHQAEAVTPVVPAARLHLDVFAHHIEAHLLHRDDVRHQRFVAGGGIDSIRPEALVERSHLEQELVVQRQPIPVTLALQAYLTHAEVGIHSIVAHHDTCIVEEWMLRVPKFSVGQAHGDGLTHGTRPSGNDVLTVIDNNSDLRIVRDGIAACNDGKGHLLLIDIRLHAIVGNVGLWHSLHPHRLPDAACAGIENATRAQHLLTARYRIVVRGVVNAQDEFMHLFVGHKCLRDVEREGVVAAFVGADGGSIDECLAAPVNSLEVEQHTLILPSIRDLERAPIGHALRMPSNAAQRCLWRKWHQDFLPRLRQGLVHLLQRLPLPQPVQVLPLCAHHLRTRILAVNVLRRHVSRPRRGDVHLGHLPR